jgi:hypothetical protein
MHPEFTAKSGAFVTTFKPLLWALRGLLALTTPVMSAIPLGASGFSHRGLEAPRTFTAEVGARFWYGWGNTAKDLYDTTGTLLVSRLTYEDYNIYSGELFTRFDFSNGWILKGYIGGGGLRGGSLIDEDFPPVVTPYSRTTSSLDHSSPFYASIDGGFKLLWGPDFHIGLFAGYHYLREHVSAFGCAQLASHPSICGGGIPDFIRVITQDNNWHALRVGVDAAVEINRLKFSVDAAWLPYAWLDGADTHWLRVGNSPGDFTGPVPEDGKGWGYQLEAVISYRLTDWINIGVGGRYWHVESDGHTHFEGHVVGANALPQVVKWQSDSYGVFLQGSFRLGPYPLISSN